VDRLGEQWAGLNDCQRQIRLFDLWLKATEGCEDGDRRAEHQLYYFRERIDPPWQPEVARAYSGGEQEERLTDQALAYLKKAAREKPGAPRKAETPRAPAEDETEAPALWQRGWVKGAAAALLLVVALVVGLLLGGLGKSSDSAKGPGDAGPKDNRPAKADREKDAPGPPVVILNEASLAKLQKTLDGLVDAFVVPDLVERVGDPKLLKELHEQLKELADLPRDPNDRDGEKTAARLAEITKKIDQLSQSLKAARDELSKLSPKAEKKRALLAIWVSGLAERPRDPQKWTERWLKGRLLRQAAERKLGDEGMEKLKGVFTLLEGAARFPSLAGQRKKVTHRLLDFYANEQSAQRLGTAGGAAAYARGLRALGKSIEDNLAVLRSKTGLGD
jgi:hypothetical protein